MTFQIWEGLSRPREIVSQAWEMTFAPREIVFKTLKTAFARAKFVFNNHPHPGPLLRGEGEVVAAQRKYSGWDLPDHSCESRRVQSLSLLPGGEG
jgi:hypothetical protein